MSMNLHSDEIDLWQTPTWISYLAMHDHEGRDRPVAEVKHIYKEWVRSSLQGSWESEDLKHARQRVKWHLEELDAIELHKLNFCIY